ncbi:alpha/beta fold hydrolase [Herbiconiux sp. A18JL235]|uniref:Alpha/beta fold hydrolase n=1 Tax=Herbiconiux sp. A18JL235 TaxID=3152363 RepID=A0AB39BCV3_9MICO
MTRRASPGAPSRVPADVDGAPEREPYAPYGLTADSTALGFETRVSITRVGPVSARLHRTPSPDGDGDGDGTEHRVVTLLLHGAAGSWTTWTPLLAELDRRDAAISDVVALDLPGWGDSTAFHPDAGIDDVAGATVDLMRSLGYSSWHVVGHSLGAFIALHLAATEPEATASASLVSPATFTVAEVARRPLRAAGRSPAFAGLLTVMRAFAPFGRAASRVLSSLRRARLLGPVVAPLFAHPRLVPDSVVAALADEVRPAAFVRAARIAAAYDLEDSWSRIRCPVRSVRGAADVFAGEHDDRMLARVVRDVTVTVIPSAGHFAHIEAPQAVATALLPAFSPRS